MIYDYSYAFDLEHKFHFMNVCYDHTSQAPVGYWPLEFSNLDNIKTARHSVVIRGLNEISSRLGAIFSIPFTLLDMTITMLAGTILKGIDYLATNGNAAREKNLIQLSNRMFANIGVLGLTALRILAGARAPQTEKNMDYYIISFMKNDSPIIPMQQKKAHPAD